MFDLYLRAFARCRPYVLATQATAPRLELVPLGVDIQETGLVLDPQRRENEPFLHLLQSLDRLAFGPLGMAMPPWVFYDCGVMPGTVFGFCGPASDLEPWVRRALGVDPAYDGPVPLSIFIAIPMLQAGAWFTHTFCTLNRVCPGAAPAGLAQLTFALGVRVQKIHELYGTDQWRSDRIAALVGFGPLEVVTAYTPAHSMVRTLPWRLRLRRLRVEAALLQFLDVDDDAALIRVQREIEAGVQYVVAGPPVVRGSTYQLPVTRKGQPA